MVQNDLVRDLNDFIVELDRARATALQNLSFGMQLRDRIVERLIRYLRQHVSDDEAEKVIALVT